MSNYVEDNSKFCDLLRKAELYLKARKILTRFPDLYMHHGVERKNFIFSSCKMMPYYAELFIV